MTTCTNMECCSNKLVANGSILHCGYSTCTRAVNLVFCQMAETKSGTKMKNQRNFCVTF